MRTRKPISTISYNSEAFLSNVLANLKRNKIISEAFYIFHKPEADTNKPHFHVYMELAKTLQTEDLRDLFKEKDPNNEKPLGVQPFQTSDFANWVWYSIHDPEYLKSKGLTREYQYSTEHVVATDRDYFEYLLSMNPRPQSKVERVKMGIINGLEDTEMLIRLNVPLEKWGSYRQSIQIMRKELHKIYRETKFDEDGEPLYDENLPF